MSDAGGQPDIVPVNFLADGDTIIIRTTDGHKLSLLEQNPLVAFEVDQVALGLAWSVVLHGSARVLTEPADLEAVRKAAFWTWPERKTDRFIRIDPHQVAGRQFAR